MTVTVSEGPAIVAGYEYRLQLEADSPVFPAGCMLVAQVRAKVIAIGGAGGNSMFGDGGPTPGVGGSVDNGNAGVLGGGGSGAADASTGASSFGGAGGAGMIRIWEYS